MTEHTPQPPHASSPIGAYPSASYAAASGPLPSGDRRQKVEATLDFLYRQRLLILLCTAVVMAAAAVYAYTRAPKYEATNLVEVNLSERSQAASPAGDAAGGSNSVFATNDRPLLGEVFLLQTTPAIRRRVAERLEELGSEAETARTLSEMVTFDVADEAASTILITVTSEDPQQAALLADLYGGEYVRLTEEAGRNHLVAQRSMLEEWEEQQRQELERIQEEQREQALRGSALTTGQEGGMAAMQIANLEGQRDQVQTELQTRRASLRAAEADLATLEPRLTQRVASDDDTRLQSLQAQVAALRTERAQTERRYPDVEAREPVVTARLRQLDNDIQRVEAEASQLSQQIISSGGLSGGGIGAASTLAYVAELRQRVQVDRAHIAALEDQAARIEGRLAEQYTALSRLPQAAMAQASRQIAQAQLERDRLYAEQTYQEAASQLRDVQAAAQTSTGYARIIQDAQVPTEPTQIPASRLLLLGAFIGLSLGLGLALARDKVDNRILKPEQLREWGYPVLATIPDLGPLVEEEFGGEEYVEMEGRRLSTRLVMLLSPLSPMAEAYRHLRTNVLSRHAGTFPAKVLLVTSPGAGDGKSTTAANLALSLSQAGHRTLLLDADLRRPSIHRLFGIPRSPGLIHHLLPQSKGEPGEQQADENGMPNVASTGIDNFYVIPAGEAAAMGDGAAPPNVVSVTALGSAKTAGYLQWLREQFDCVVIDTPPVLATTDALQLASQCDAVIVTARARQTREGELTHVLEALEQIGAPVVGTVLNGFDLSMAYGYKYRYRSYTDYGLYPEYGLREQDGKKRRRVRKGTEEQPTDGLPRPAPSPSA